MAILAQGIACTLFVIVLQAGESLRVGYQLLVDMSVITYFIPYLFLFASMIRLQSRRAPAGALRVPGGKGNAIGLACMGLLSTVAAIVLSLFPAEDDPNPKATLIKVSGMTILLLAAAVAIYFYSKRRKAAEPKEHSAQASIDA